MDDISDCQVGDLGYASELGNYAEYSGAPKEEEVLHYARVVLDVRNLESYSFALHIMFIFSVLNIILKLCSVPLLILMAGRELFSLEGVSQTSLMSLLHSVASFGL